MYIIKFSVNYYNILLKILFLILQILLELFHHNTNRNFIKFQLYLV